MNRKTISRRLLPALLIGAAGTSQAAEYTLTIHESPADLAKRTDAAAGPAYWSAWGAYAKAITDAGIVRGGSAVLPAEAQAVRFVKGKPAPAGALKSAVPMGGFFVIDVADAATAAQWAARAPLGDGEVDVQPNLKRDMH